MLCVEADNKFSGTKSVTNMGISVSERFLRQTREISRAFEDQQLIADELIRMMRRTLKKIQTIYIKDLLYGLMVRNMGTPE